MKQQLEEIFEQYRGILYRVAFTHVKNHADAEDMVQETFMRLLRSQPILKTGEHRKAWLLRTLLNLCKDHEKQAWNRKRTALTEIPEQEKPYFQVPCVEEDETLWAVLALPARYRNPLYLFYYEDYSIREIAELLGEQENTVKTQLKRGREELRKQFEKERSKETDDS